MILADTSVWVDHFRSGGDLLAERLEQRQILMHPFVLGELMLGGLRSRREVVGDLRMLPRVTVATHDEVEALIEGERLDGRGIGYVDAALLTSVKLHNAARLWTADRRLALAAAELSIGAD